MCPCNSSANFSPVRSRTGSCGSNRCSCGCSNNSGSSCGCNNGGSSCGCNQCGCRERGNPVLGSLGLDSAVAGSQHCFGSDIDDSPACGACGADFDSNDNRDFRIRLFEEVFGICHR
ncbi:MAG: hypothetical protein KH354_03255 [Clostridiales bacterium]|nr:hypothetical protein [Clostridiales bacterium]